MEQQFDLRKVIEVYKLDVNDVAEALFPHVRYKNLALNRVLKGEAFLDTQQIQILANLAGVFIQDLFMLNKWRGKNENGYLTLCYGDYKVILNYNGAFLTLIKNGHVQKQELINTKCITIDDFLTHINSLIKNF